MHNFCHTWYFKYFSRDQKARFQIWWYHSIRVSKVLQGECSHPGRQLHRSWRHTTCSMTEGTRGYKRDGHNHRDVPRMRNKGRGNDGLVQGVEPALGHQPEPDLEATLPRQALRESSQSVAVIHPPLLREIFSPWVQDKSGDDALRCVPHETHLTFFPNATVITAGCTPASSIVLPTSPP